MRKHNNKKLCLNKSTVSSLTDVKGGMISIIFTYFSLYITCGNDGGAGGGGGREQRSLTCQHCTTPSKDCPTPPIK